MIRKVTLNILIAAHGEPTPFIIRVEHVHLIGQALCCILSQSRLDSDLSFNQLLSF